MKPGIYTVDSIEKGMVKLLFREDESIEEVIPVEQLDTDLQQGDIVKIEIPAGDVKVEVLKEETESIKDQARRIKEELLKRNK